MKLLSLNVDGCKYHEGVKNFLEHEQADVVCLQEAHPGYVDMLSHMGYQTSFLPCYKREQEGQCFVDGVLLASTYNMSASQHYYYQPNTTLPVSDFDINGNRLNWRGFVFADIQTEAGLYQVATTHFTWTPNGSQPNQEQRGDIVTFAELMQTMPAHVMCGDFNIPRHHSDLYESLTQLYRDEIPARYGSSLDKSLHKLGDNPEKTHLFTDYVVDYVFTQSPYQADNVRLEFGVSDHAAVVADISR